MASNCSSPTSHERQHLGRVRRPVHLHRDAAGRPGGGVVPDVHARDQGSEQQIGHPVVPVARASSWSWTICASVLPLIENALSALPSSRIRRSVFATPSPFRLEFREAPSPLVAAFPEDLDGVVPQVPGVVETNRWPFTDWWTSAATGRPNRDAVPNRARLTPEE